MESAMASRPKRLGYNISSVLTLVTPVVDGQRWSQTGIRAYGGSSVNGLGDCMAAIELR
jgi:LDH2 family malate/lactate/ureidoglycolate dehydrogenase